MLPGDTDKQPGLANPLLQPNDGLRTVAGILILTMNSPDERRRLGITDNSPTDLTIDDGRSDPALLGITASGPFVHVEVDSPSKDTARTLQAAAQARVREQLNTYQRMLGAPRSTYIGISTVASLGPDESYTVKYEAAAAALLGGLVVGLSSAYAVTSRRDRRRRPPSGGPDVVMWRSAEQIRGIGPAGGTTGGNELSRYEPEDEGPEDAGTQPETPPRPKEDQPREPRVMTTRRVEDTDESGAGADDDTQTWFVVEVLAPDEVDR
ncbi:hypothetical protein JOL79_21665 [Microbispora sp. RL4-1S]|uniref:Uncharacterized protein n=1 Tax=Microbispora oryzae TaxID=2806554 RepID=A0A941AKS8_9ACTN|nr:hypothetical protein [Microbispora oryzae]MBP2706422.1 hypothetical protein [Microbispora oryzae]